MPESFQSQTHVSFNVLNFRCPIVFPFKGVQFAKSFEPILHTAGALLRLPEARAALHCRGPASWFGRGRFLRELPCMSPAK